mmetsp:Transcript_11391/g.18873  ORF Transcript_11391/g.18873 Transcript_11391/m.18873 type:complete len:285 (-) Transcript_11391:207-1061(-)
MERETFPSPMFFTRTLTISSTLQMSVTELARPAVRAEMWTKPSNSPSISSPNCLASTRTKAPKATVLTTLPVINTDESNPLAETAARVALSSRRFPPRGLSLFARDLEIAALASSSSSSDNNERATCPLTRSISTIRTSTSCPAATTSLTSLTNSLDMREICNKPSEVAPKSQKAPYEATDLMTALTVVPTANSERGVPFEGRFFFNSLRAGRSALWASSLDSTPSMATTSVGTSSSAGAATSSAGAASSVASAKSMVLVRPQDAQPHPAEWIPEQAAHGQLFP